MSVLRAVSTYDRGETAFALRAPGPTESLLVPEADVWQEAPEIHFARDASGQTVHGHETTVQMVWDHLYLSVRFRCKYEELYLLEGAPVLNRPTDRLWDRDVAEVFIAAGEEAPTRYAEFEVSPRGEWLALSIETGMPGMPAGKPLQVRTHFAASIDHSSRIWTGLMCIPFSSLMEGDPTAGMPFRINLFRSQGPQPVELAWQPTMHASFHVPERFGLLVLEAK